MYHQVRVRAEDRDLLRFLWWEDGQLDQQPIEYRMKVHPFGATSSPGCANFALKQTAEMYEEEFGHEAAEFIRNDFYVDDGLKSVATVEDAVSLVKDSRDICKRGGFKLCKFTSNVVEVSEIANEAVRSLDLCGETAFIERTLGVQWCIQSDMFNFRVMLQDKPVTRRGILSTVSSVFDPLGLISPVLLTGKKILQDICREGSEWDDPLPEDVRRRWEKWRCELLQLEQIKIPRCYKERNMGELKSAELHHFSDACLSGYGQCSYLKLTNTSNKISCSLVMSKAKVTPLKSITVPRLELAAAVTSVKVSGFLMEQLKYEGIQVKEFFWSDSQAVLSYISNETRRFHIFVANRVQEIRNHTTPDQWNHISTTQNPADLASRGTTTQELATSKLSWKGPSFLKTGDFPQNDKQLTLDPDDPEVKKMVLTTQAKVVNKPAPDLLERLERFSSWFKAERAIAHCLQLKGR